MISFYLLDGKIVRDYLGTSKKEEQAAQYALENGVRCVNGDIVEYYPPQQIHKVVITLEQRET